MPNISLRRVNIYFYLVLYVTMVSASDIIQEFIDRDLNSIPVNSIFNNVTVLKLSKNNLQTLEDFGFEDFGDIKQLQLGDNNISYISPLAFYGLHKIWRLNLSHNALQYLPDLRNLSESLQYLYLDSNQIKTVNGEYLQLSLLSYLSMYKNELTAFNIKSQLENLRTIHLTNNKLSQLPTIETILPNFGLLNLGQNDISGILSCEYFDNIPHLYWLSIQNNKLNRSELCGPALTYIDISYNDLTEPPIIHNALRNLQHFFLQANTYSTIEENYFNKTPNVKYLHISHTGINALPDLSVLKSLSQLWASNNNLVSIATEQLRGFGELSYLYLSYNDLEVIPDFQQLAAESESSSLLVYLFGSNLYCGPELCWLKHLSRT